MREPTGADAAALLRGPSFLSGVKCAVSAQRRAAPAVDVTSLSPVGVQGVSNEVSTLCREPTMLHNADRLVPSPVASKQYTVVLDLDETLVYARDGPLMARAHLKEFLRATNEHCEIVAWTAGDRLYAKAVLAEINVDGVIQHLIYRHKTWFNARDYTKDLKRLGRDMAYVLIIENTPDCVRNNPQNAVIVDDFEGDRRSDSTLLHLAALMKALGESHQPVPEFLARCPLLRRQVVKYEKREVPIFHLSRRKNASGSAKLVQENRDKAPSPAPGPTEAQEAVEEGAPVKKSRPRNPKRKNQRIKSKTDRQSTKKKKKKICFGRGKGRKRCKHIVMLFLSDNIVPTRMPPKDFLAMRAAARAAYHAKLAQERLRVTEERLRQDETDAARGIESHFTSPSRLAERRAAQSLATSLENTAERREAMLVQQGLIKTRTDDTSTAELIEERYQEETKISAVAAGPSVQQASASAVVRGDAVREDTLPAHDGVAKAENKGDARFVLPSMADIHDTVRGNGVPLDVSESGHPAQSTSADPIAESGD